MPSALTQYLHKWALIADGLPIQTASATLLPVRWQDQPAILKVSTSQEERRGYDLLEAWNGNSAAKVFARSGDALLMERATGAKSLVELSRTGHDKEACRIICDVVGQLHQQRATSAVSLPSLNDYFNALNAHNRPDIPALHASHKAMQTLLAHPHDIVCLHGDIHHQNILDFVERGWLAIDPKGLIGERAFDYANLFCNPDADIACNKDRFLSRLNDVARYASLDRQRLLQWVLAWAGLSAIWHIEDGTDPGVALQIATLAAAVLGA